MKKIVIALILLLLATLLMPVVAVQTNFVEASRGEIPDFLEIGKQVNVRITLDEVSPDLATMTNLTFKTDLEYPVWGFAMKGSSGLESDEASSSNKALLLFDHSKYDNITVSLSGEAPIQEKKMEILLISIKQTDIEGEQSLEVIKSIRRDVTAQDIEGAITSIDNAKEAIRDVENLVENVTEDGIEIDSETRAYLNLASWHLQEANRHYSDSKMEEALISANNAISNATLASERVSSQVAGEIKHQESMRIVQYVVILAIVVVAIIVVIILRKKAGWDKIG